MKINNAGTKPAAAHQAQLKDLDKNIKAGKSPNADKTSAMAGSTKVNMSSDAQALQKAKSIASADTIDEAKVARLQKLIDEGKYKVDAASVADRLVDEHLLTGE